MLVCVNGIAEGLSGKSTPRGEEDCDIPASIKPSTRVRLGLCQFISKR
jgi:hypothetical protein